MNLAAQGALHEILVADELGGAEYQRQHPVEDGGFPLDEHLVAEHQGSAPEDHDRQQQPQQALLEAAVDGVGHRHLYHRGRHQHGGGGEYAVHGVLPSAQGQGFAVHLVDDEKQDDRQELG